MKHVKHQKTKLAIRFNAELFDDFLILPKSASMKIPGRGKTIIEGVVNCFPFQAAVESKKKGGLQFKVDKAMRGAIHANIGDVIEVEVTRVADESETRVPGDLSRALAAIPSAKKSWADITPMARRDWIFSICSAKQAETRKRRIDKACDMLASGKRRLCCFPGIKWLMKENARSCGMWLPLSNSKNRASS